MQSPWKWWGVCVVLLVAIGLPESAWAWGPATHFHYGLMVLDRLHLLGELRPLFANYSIEFLYGCLSADIVLAKKLGRAMTHCHKWDMGIRLIEEAEKPRIKAFAYGYVSHLAADTISHNCYVPSKTIQSYSGGILKHLYWELLFDRRLTTKRTLRLFEEISKGDFTECDEHLERLVPTRIFDFSFNKGVFNQLLMLQGLHQWQKLWSSLSESSPWPLKDEEVKHYTQRAVEAIMNFLRNHRESKFLLADPQGQNRLQAANEIRRHFKHQMLRKNPPSDKEVKAVLEQFKADPFHPILAADLKAA